MKDKVLRVTVKNRLGMKFGSQHLEIVENEESGSSQRIGPRDDAHLPTGKRKALQSVDIETGKMMRQTALPPIPPIPITIESPVDCHVAVKQVSGQNKWRLEFKAIRSAKDVVAKDGDEDTDPDKVNVTLGSDEPPAPPPPPSPMIYAGGIGFGAGWLISSCLPGVAPLIGYGVPILALGIGIIGVVLTRRKKIE